MFRAKKKYSNVFELLGSFMHSIRRLSLEHVVVIAVEQLEKMFYARWK